MGKLEAVAEQKAALLAGQDQIVEQVLGNCYDQGANDQKASDGSFQQADIDAAVAAAVGPLNDKIAQDQKDLADAQAAASEQLSALQVALDAMTAKEQMEEKAIQDLQASAEQVQAALDAIKALIFPTV